MDENQLNNYQEKNNLPSSRSESDSVKQKKNMPPKLIFGVLLVFGAFVLIFGFVNVANNIYGPSNFWTSQQNIPTDQGDNIADLLELQSIDSDKDGLSDYDEIYIYKTSAYLPDTDSDGYLDGAELESGNDPLCPSGADCRGVNTQPSEDVVNEENDLLPPETEPLPPEVLEELNKLTPDEVRQLLRASGELTEEQISDLDDETLMEIFQEVLLSQ